MVDPWGLPDRAATQTESLMRLPVWVRSIARLMSLFNPLATVRAAGPWGHALVRRVRPDLGRRYQTDAIYDYIYQANAADNPTYVRVTVAWVTVRYSGEAAFKSVSHMFGWARRPMSERLDKLVVPVTFMYVVP